MIGCFNHRVVAWLMLVPQTNRTEIVSLFPPYFLVPEWRNNKERLLSIYTFGFPLS